MDELFTTYNCSVISFNINQLSEGKISFKTRELKKNWVQSHKISYLDYSSTSATKNIDQITARIMVKTNRPVRYRNKQACFTRKKNKFNLQKKNLIYLCREAVNSIHFYFPNSFEKIVFSFNWRLVPKSKSQPYNHHHHHRLSSVFHATFSRTTENSTFLCNKDIWHEDMTVAVDSETHTNGIRPISSHITRLTIFSHHGDSSPVSTEKRAEHFHEWMSRVIATGLWWE